MPEFRAIVDSSSPRADADALRGAGITLVGPWAADPASAAQLVAEEHDVTVLLREASPEDVEEKIRSIVSQGSRIRNVAVKSAGNDAAEAQRQATQ